MILKKFINIFYNNSLQCQACVAEARFNRNFSSLDLCEGLLQHLIECIGRAGPAILKPEEARDVFSLEGLYIGERRADASLVEGYARLYGGPLEGSRASRRAVTLIEESVEPNFAEPSEVSEISSVSSDYIETLMWDEPVRGRKRG